MSHPASRLPHLSLVLVLAVAVLVLGTLALRGPLPVSEAAPTSPAVDVAYLFVTGEGPSAKAWFRDAPSTGLPVQDALDRFTKQGYVAKLVTNELRSTSDSVAFAILLERVR